MRPLALILALFWSPLSDASALDRCLSLFTHPATVSTHFQDMAIQRQLLHQHHPDLKAQGLIKKDGGLCGPTCIANALQSFSGFRGEPQSFPAATWVGELVQRLEGHLKKDPRMGLTLEDLATGLDLWLEKNPEVPLSVELFTEVRELDFVPPQNALHVVGIKNGSKDGLHAIVVLEVNAFEQTLILSDPVFNNILHTPYESYHKNNRSLIRIDLEGAEQFPELGEVIGWLRISYNP